MAKKDVEISIFIIDMKLLHLIILTLLYTTAYSQDSTNIFFATGSSKLSTERMALLDSLVYHNVITPYKKYSIIGFADNTGGEQANKQLSINRANAVFDYLKDLGIDSNSINVLTGKGAIGAANIQNDANKRVDIVAVGAIAQPLTSTKQSKTSIDISKTQKGETIRLDNIFFNGGQYQLLPASIPTLDELVKAMKLNPNLVIQIEGHVHETPEPNWIKASAYRKRNADLYDQNEYQMQKLSDNRAKAVYDYLIAHGIEAKRLKYIGFSNTRFYESPENNKRVEIRILDK